jgi:hypothetical protein
MTSRTIKEHSEINVLLNAVDFACTKALYSGPVEVVIQRPKDPRSLSQNKKLWALCGDFTASKIEIGGRHNWTPEDWKCFLMSAFNSEMPVFGLNGEPVMLGLSTSKLSKKRFSELVEFIHATGSDKGVRWSEPSILIYEQYMSEV